jgi:hypothetical protein
MRTDALILLTALGLAACGRSEAPKTTVARVGGHTLTVEEIRAQLQTAGEPSQAQMQQVVQRWVADEVLYREAVSRGLDQSADVNARVEELRRQLAINALLDRDVYGATPPAFTRDELQAYYDAHPAEFILPQDMAVVSFALFKQRDAATAFRNMVLQGTGWSEAVLRSGASLVARADSVHHTQQSLRPAELWRVAAFSPVRVPSFPVNTADGYYVVVTWRMLKQGQTADLPAVEQEIRNRLTIEFRERRYQELVNSLRSRQPIEVFIGTGAPDSARTRPAE